MQQYYRILINLVKKLNSYMIWRKHEIDRFKKISNKKSYRMNKFKNN